MNQNFFDENLDSIKINQRINIAESILDYYAPYDGDDDIVMEIMENFILACSMQSRFEEGKYFAEKQLDWSCEKMRIHIMIIQRKLCLI